MINTIILVSTGTFQEYILYNINQLLLLSYNIIVITEQKYFDHFDKNYNIQLIDSNTINIDKFDSKSKLNKDYRNGFWHLCSKRLFLVYYYMKKYNQKNVIHLENDVLLYTKFNNFNFNEDKLYLTIDSNDRCIPGILYIPTYEIMDNLIRNYDYTKNDMINMYSFYKNNKSICETFPIINYVSTINIYNKNFSEFDGIFDGAAIGQYLGGIDSRNKSGNTIGFINETCVIKYNKYTFKWIVNNNLYYPFIIIDGIEIPIYNLHIHSKLLELFTIINPADNKLIQKIR